MGKTWKQNIPLLDFHFLGIIFKNGQLSDKYILHLHTA